MSIETLNWKLIRVLYVSTGVISGIRIHTEKTGFPSPALFSVFILIFSPFIISGVYWMNSKILPQFWNPPNWNANPFASNEPFQFFHTIFWQAIVTGVVGCLILPWIENSSAGQSFVYIAIGVGGLLGILRTIRGFPNRLQKKHISTITVIFGTWQDSNSVK